MKKIYRIALIWVVGLSTMAMTSCLSDTVADCEQPAETLTLNIAFNALGTRAIEDGVEALNENKIETLDAFFYEGNTLKWKVTDVLFDAAHKKAVIPIAVNKRALFENNTTHTYDVYVVANNTADVSSIAEEADNLQALKDIVLQTPDFVTKGGGEAQASFVMDGKITQMITLNNPDLGTVNLKRAASKIRLSVVGINVPNYTVEGDVKARLVHFSNKSALLDGDNAPTMGDTDWKTTSDKTMAFSGTQYQMNVPFYAYENNWQTDESRETYIELLIPLKDQNDLISIFKYRVPVTPRGLTGDDAQYMNRLYRNYLYDIAVTVKILGSVDEPPVEVTGNYTIKNWTTKEVLIDVKGAHYLVVSERNVVMPNIKDYTLTFNSSVPNVTLVPNSIKATYTYVRFSDGQVVTENATGNQFPSVNVEEDVASGFIKISSSIPVNSIPKDIEFKVINGQNGLTETVNIRQLPATYFTSERGDKSSVRPNGDWASNSPPQRNRYMYMINTLAPAGDIIWGFPPLDANGNTIDNSEVSNMVSPRFMMASQLGAISANLNYSQARTHCQNYWEETIINGTPKRYNDWRMPTEAEIHYIDNLQHDSNNPQGIVMHGKWYWDSFSTNGATEMASGTIGGQWSTSVRCIRDIKD